MAQRLQLDPEPMEYDPELQTNTELAPAGDQYPGATPTQLLIPGTGAYVPDGHNVQLDDNALAYEPVPHINEEVAPIVHDDPDGHGKQALNPLVGEYVPGKQGRHVENINDA